MAIKSDNKVFRIEKISEESIVEGVATMAGFAKKNADSGRWPGSTATLWSLRANSSTNGFQKAFITIGRRVLVVEKEFWRAVLELQEVKK